MRLCILFIQLKEAKHVIISCIRLFIIVGSLQILIQWNNKSLSKNKLICRDFVAVVWKWRIICGVEEFKRPCPWLMLMIPIKTHDLKEVIKGITRNLLRLWSNGYRNWQIYLFVVFILSGAC